MARHVKTRKTYPAIGIVGEGGVERTYFTQLRQIEQLMFTIKPDLPDHAHYTFIIDKAQKMLHDGFDLVFCVFDMDTIRSNQASMQEYMALKDRYHGRHLHFIENHPSMELWFLLHFINTCKEYDSNRQLMKELKKHLPAYEKTEKYLNRPPIYHTLKPYQPLARRNAQHNDNPNNGGSKSQIYQILDYLRIL